MEMLGARYVIVEDVTCLGDVPGGEQFEYFLMLVKGSIPVYGRVHEAIAQRSDAVPDISVGLNKVPILAVLNEGLMEVGVQELALEKVPRAISVVHFFRDFLERPQHRGGGILHRDAEGALLEQQAKIA
jgi:hypothetical protein